MSQSVVESPDLDVLESAAALDVAGWDQRIAELALPSLSSEKAARELADARSCREACVTAQETLVLARAERSRLDALEARRVAQEAREAAYMRARVLQVDREAAVRAVDRALRNFACALADLDRIATSQQAELSQAGRDGTLAIPRPWMVEEALTRALLDAKVPRGMVERPPAVGRVRSLTESDVRPVVPASDEERDGDGDGC